MLVKRLRDDSGVALVTAIMASLVVLTLSVVGFELATHNLQQSGANRRTVQSVHAAEAGLDRFLDYLANSAAITAPACRYPLGGGAESLGTEPVTTFSVETTYYASSDATGTPLGTPASCPATFSTTPRSAVITSVGTIGGKTRTMQTLVELLPNAGSSLSNAAVFANGAATWTGQASISHAAGTELPANIYSNGNVELKGGGVVAGKVEAQGSVILSGTADVKRFVTSRGALTVNKNAIIRANGRSSTSSVSNNGTIGGDAYYCTGSAPGATVNGSRIQECKPEEPPVQNFRQITFDASEWSDPSRDPSYTVNTYTSCSAAETFLRSEWTGNYVVRINSTCSLTIPNVVIRGNLAIITNGDIAATGSTSITRIGTEPTYTLQLMGNFLHSPNVTGGPTCGSNSGLSFAAGTTFPAAVDVLFWTPCDVKFTGNATANIQGQIVSGRDVTFSSGSNITYKPIIVPGTSPTGFRESVRYRSEVIN